MQCTWWVSKASIQTRVLFLSSPLLSIRPWQLVHTHQPATQNPPESFYCFALVWWWNFMVQVHRVWDFQKAFGNTNLILLWGSSTGSRTRVKLCTGRSALWHVASLCPSRLHATLCSSHNPGFLEHGLLSSGNPSRKPALTHRRAHTRETHSRAPTLPLHALPLGGQAKAAHWLSLIPCPD